MPIWSRSKSKKPDSESRQEVEPRPRADSAPPDPPKPASLFRLGETLCLKGELMAGTDVEILGQLDGTVRLDGHHLLVAETARVTAEISARSVTVFGQVAGNVTASESIRIGAGGCVLGDLCAPSIQLEDGSRFTGGINRESTPAKVSGQLNGDEPDFAPAYECDTSTDHARRVEIPGRRGTSGPWDPDSTD